MWADSSDIKKCYVTFIDDYSHFAVIYTLRSKSEMFEAFRDYAEKVFNKFNRKIEVVRIDGRTECKEARAQNMALVGYTVNSLMTKIRR